MEELTESQQIELELLENKAILEAELAIERFEMMNRALGLI